MKVSGWRLLAFDKSPHLADTFVQAIRDTGVQVGSAWCPPCGARSLELLTVWATSEGRLILVMTRRPEMLAKRARKALVGVDSPKAREDLLAVAWPMARLDGPVLVKCWKCGHEGTVAIDVIEGGQRRGGRPSALPVTALR